MSSVRDALVLRGMPLAEIVARRLCRRMGGAVELDELLGIGRAALVEIAAAFDPERGAFEPFVARRLVWASLSAVRKNKGGLARARARALAASHRYGEALRRDAGAEPRSLDDVPSEEAAQARLRALLEGHAAAMAIALHAASSDVEAARDHAEDPEQRVSRAEVEGGIRDEVRALPDRERALVERHYYGEERFDAIAGDLGISKAWASRLHAAAIDQLARRLRARFGPSLATGT